MVADFIITENGLVGGRPHSVVNRRFTQSKGEEYIHSPGLETILFRTDTSVRYLVRWLNPRSSELMGYRLKEKS